MNIEQEQNKIKLTKQEYLKQWRENNKEKMQLLRKAWYASHKDDETFKQQKREYNKSLYEIKKQKKQLEVSN
jgi:hypothetical protein